MVSSVLFTVGKGRMRRASRGVEPAAGERRGASTGDVAVRMASGVHEFDMSVATTFEAVRGGVNERSAEEGKGNEPNRSWHLLKVRGLRTANDVDDKVYRLTEEAAEPTQGGRGGSEYAVFLAAAENKRKLSSALHCSTRVYRRRRC
jgi:hypothetical protein